MTALLTDPSNLIKLFGVAVFTLFIAFWLSGPALMLWAEWRGKSSGRVFYDKCARQLALLNVYLQIILVSLFAYSAFILPATANLAEAAQATISYSKLLLACAISTSFILSLAYLFTWQKMKEVKVLHIALGLAGWVCSLSITAAGLSLLYIQLSGEYFGLNSPSHPALNLLNAICSLESLTVVQTLPFLTASLYAGSMFAALWLLLRRNREDYGRDYYRFALSLASRWTMWTILLSLATCLALFAILKLRYPEASNPLAYTDIPAFAVSVGTLFLTLCLVFLWGWISRSPNPLRAKLAMLMASFLLLCASTGAGATFINSFSKPVLQLHSIEPQNESALPGQDQPIQTGQSADPELPGQPEQPVQPGQAKQAE